MERHWSFVACDPKYLFPLSLLILAVALYFAISRRDATLLPRFGNFVVAIGVWMSMRYVFREGIGRSRNALAGSPVLPDGQLNVDFLNNITLSIGDAKLSIYGLLLVVIGSIIGSFGDLILKHLLPRVFREQIEE